MNKEELIEYLNTHDMDVQSARAMFLFAELVYQSYADSSVVDTATFSPVVCAFKADRFFQFINRSAIDGAANKVYDNFLIDSGSLDKLIDDHRSFEFKMDELWEEMRSKLQEANLETLKDYYSRFIVLMKKWWQHAAIGEDKGGLVERELVPEFAKKHGVSEMEALEVMGMLSHPDELAMFTKERQDFFELCISKLEKDVGFSDRIKEFVREYFWKDMDFYECRIVDIDSVIADIEKETGEKGLEEIKKEIEEIERETVVIRERKEEIRRKYDLDEGDRKDIEFAIRMTQWQEWRKLGMMKHLYYVFYLLEVLAEKLGVSYEDLAYSTLGEMKDFFAGGGRLDKEAIERRKTGAVFVFTKGKPLTELGSEAYGEVMAFIEEGAKGGELSGIVASQGKGKPTKVEGKARIIVNPLKEKFEDGEILVTSMTRVEFVPLMRRAKAIITDEGGITTHAAIVSRELGVPCVIGTKRATKMLRNGDNVEIDMNSGAIKVIK